MGSTRKPINKKPDKKAQAKTTDSPTVGRPSKYESVFSKQAYKLCLLGATDKDLAAFFEVDESTINNWKLEHPEFLESIKKGKVQADAEVANRLYRRAMGFKHKAVKFFQDKGEILKKEYTEIYPPDTTAAIFWLKNRQPQVWRDKQEIDHTSAGKELKRFTLNVKPDTDDQ